MYQSFPLMSILEKMSNLLCTESFKPTLEICSNMFLSIVGYNQYEVELEMVRYELELFINLQRCYYLFNIFQSVLTNLVQNISPFISTMQLIHFIQTMLSGKFRQYDHKDQNMKFYNSTSPPEYDLNKIKAPIYLYHGENDAIVSELVKGHLELIIIFFY